ncbi:MAG TPA: hypothetical protein VJY47_03365 [Candidatus Dojkabacteria bacterium]|nr:hypothetical protein [Candidatus Dojkabacteria bacterium]
MKYKKHIAWGLAILILVASSFALIKRFNTHAQTGVTKTFTTKVTVGNSAPVFTVDPAESPASSTTSPTAPNTLMTFSAKATDANNHGYYFLVCSIVDTANPDNDRAVASPTGGAPSCPATSTKYCGTTSAVASGSTASCTRTTESSDPYENKWNAYVCDNFASGSSCSLPNRGSGASGSPFYVNHAPTFTAISNTASTVEDAQTPGNSYTVTWTSTASDPTDGHQVKLLICKTQQMSNGVCTGGNWCESTLANSDPTCTYTLPAVPVADGEYEAYAYVVDAHNTPAAGEGTKQGSKSSYYVKNVAPVVSAVKLNAEASPITLVAGGTKSVSITADVTDDNGCSATELPVTKIKAYVYRSGLANGFSDCDALGDGNANYCYAEISCTRGTCSGTKVPITCSVSMQYYADPTDSNNAATSFASQHWVATVKATDNGFGTGGTNPLSHNATSTAVVEVASLAAFNITASIDYDEVAAGERSGNGKLDKTIVTTPTGNVPMNQLYSGSNMCTDYDDCSTDAGYTPINVNKQKYALAANTSYATGGTALSATPTLVNINVPKVTDGTNVTTRTSWWGIEIPTNTLPGVYNGLNTITSQVKTT